MPRPVGEHSDWGKALQSDVSWDEPADDRDQKALRRIADLLGCSVHELRESNGLGREPGQTAELLRLWFLVREDHIRLSVLDYLQRAVGEPGKAPL